MNINTMIEALESGSYSHEDLMKLAKVVEAKKSAAWEKRKMDNALAATKKAEDRAAAKAVEKTDTVKSTGTFSKDSFDIGDMVEFAFNRGKVVGKIVKVNEKSVVVYFHKVYRDVDGDVEQRIDMGKVLVNLTKSAAKSAAIAA